MVKDLNVLLASGVIKILEAGFPALALDIAKGGLAAENLGQIFGASTSGASTTFSAYRINLLAK